MGINSSSSLKSEPTIWLLWRLLSGHFTAESLQFGVRSNVEVGCWSTYYDTKDEPEAVRLLDKASKLPSIVVFDLDYTLWPYFCDRRSENECPVLYPQAKGVIQALKSKGVLMAIASRSPALRTARTFLSKLDLLSAFSVMEVYPSRNDKVDHFQKIHLKTGIPYNCMLFFDDEERNIQAVTEMGVKAVLVHSGVNLAALKAGLEKLGRPGPPSAQKWRDHPNRGEVKTKDCGATRNRRERTNLEPTSC